MSTIINLPIRISKDSTQSDRFTQQDVINEIKANNVKIGGDLGHLLLRKVDGMVLGEIQVERQEPNDSNSFSPCPFCKRTNVDFISNVEDGEREKEYVVCLNNNCKAEGATAKNKDEAMEKWNKVSNA